MRPDEDFRFARSFGTLPEAPPRYLNAQEAGLARFARGPHEDSAGEILDQQDVAFTLGDDSRRRHSDSLSLPVDFPPSEQFSGGSGSRRGQQDEDSETIEPPGPGDDEGCDMRLWSYLPGPQEGFPDGRFTTATSTHAGFAPKASQVETFSDQASEEPPEPPKQSCYFDLDADEFPPDSDSRRQEHHRLRFLSGASYEGEWFGNMRHGVGEQKWEDGTEYFGEWHGGRAVGNGRIRHADGDVYTGQWVNGQAHGCGVYRFQGGHAVYEGEFACDLRHGVGVEIWIDNSFYAGEFRKGMKHGAGEHNWPDDTQYQGYWSANDLCYAGRLSLNDATVYEGQWRNSVIHGRGCYTWSNGQRYEGQYSFDKKHGFGILTTANGKRKEGFWLNGEHRKTRRGNLSMSRFA